MKRLGAGLARLLVVVVVAVGLTETVEALIEGRYVEVGLTETVEALIEGRYVE
jgi:hypothetical protein